MSLFPFDSYLANVLLMTVYGILVGGIANVVVTGGFSVLDKHTLRRR